MDSRGVYDGITRCESSALGQKLDRDAVDVAGIRRGTREGMNQIPVWCPGDVNLGDGLTKDGAEARKVIALYQVRKAWTLKLDQDFVSARKAQKLRRSKAGNRPGIDEQVNTDILESMNELDWNQLDEYVETQLDAREI